MFYFSTNHLSPKADFREATIKGQAPDKGLYFPETIPQLQKEFIADINKYSKEEIALKIIQPFVGETIPKNELERIVSETINFDFPLIKVEENIFSLELYHGPTLAFKDVGAKFMSRCLGYFMQHADKKITVLVATSGDTGGAVANGFYDVDGVDVVILYPAGKVSSIQELQLTTLGKNITAIKIDGSFDDCQHLVKKIFADEELNKKLFLTSANSINVARWLPQQFYYFFAYQQWKSLSRSFGNKNEPPVISVPSGNFGNICAGLLAHVSGLPVKHFIAACNANDVVHNYLETENYTSKPSVATLSNAMDVGNPSNFVRILRLFQNKFSSLKNVMSSYTISDEETKKTLHEVYLTKKYLLDPHGAVAYLSLKKYLEQHENDKGIFLETAHPAKFYAVVEPIINSPVEMPGAVKKIMNDTQHVIAMPNNFEKLKEYFLS